MAVADDSERTLAPIERTSVTALAIERIRDLTLSGTYKPGDKLPSERALREQLGVGRSTVREALRALEALGLVELRQGSGAVVLAPTSEPPQVPTFADWPAADEWRIEDVLQARIELEGEAAAMAAADHTSEQLETISNCLEEFDRAIEVGDLSSMVLADVAFHSAIAECANPVMAAWLNSITVQGVRSRHVSLGREERRTDVGRRHHAIYEAIERGESSLARASMRSHLVDFAKELGVSIRFT